MTSFSSGISSFVGVMFMKQSAAVPCRVDGRQRGGARIAAGMHCDRVAAQGSQFLYEALMQVDAFHIHDHGLTGPPI
jgi:hypothetical protein